MNLLQRFGQGLRRSKRAVGCNCKEALGAMLAIVPAALPVIALIAVGVVFLSGGFSHSTPREPGSASTAAATSDTAPATAGVSVYWQYASLCYAT